MNVENNMTGYINEFLVNNTNDVTDSEDEGTVVENFDEEQLNQDNDDETVAYDQEEGKEDVITRRF
jgi:hypothetical protein